MSDKSKRIADDKHIAERYRREQANKREFPVQCRSCRKSQKEVPVMVEMGGFVFCSECIEAAYSVVAERTLQKRGN